MMRRIGILAILSLTLLLAACVPSKKEKDLDSRLLQYEQMIRWSQWDGAAGYIAPEYLEENPGVIASTSVENRPILTAETADLQK